MATIIRYRCSKCGAPKETDRLHFMLICDYCSNLIGFDDIGFEKSEQYQAFLEKQYAPATPGSVPHRLSVLFYYEMEVARLSKNRRDWEEKAREYWRLFLEYYYKDFLVEFSGDPMCRAEKLVEDTILWYGTSYFDPRVSNAWEKYETAWHAFKAKPHHRPEKTAKKLMALYHDLLKKLYQVIRPEDLGVSCEPGLLIGQSMQRWLAGLVKEAEGKSKEVFEELLDHWIEQHATVEEEKVEVHEGKVSVDCRGCGARYKFPAKDGAYSCPSCGSSLRFLSETSRVIRRLQSKA